MERLAGQFMLDLFDRPYSDLFPSKSIPWVAIFSSFVVIMFVYTILTYTVLIDEDELPVNFTVPIPEQCSPTWEGEILDNPNMKVSTMFLESITTDQDC